MNNIGRLAIMLFSVKLKYNAQVVHGHALLFQKQTSNNKSDIEKRTLGWIVLIMPWPTETEIFFEKYLDENYPDIFYPDNR